jgi:Amidase
MNVPHGTMDRASHILFELSSIVARCSPASSSAAAPHAILLLLVVVGSLIVTATVRLIRTSARVRRKRATYRQWIRRAREERDAKQHPILLLRRRGGDGREAEKDPIVPPPPSCLSAAETARRVASGSLDVAENLAFLARRCRALGREDGLNAIAEEFYKEGAERAEQLTLQHWQSETLPVLYGVPICVKEFISLKASHSTAGLACRLRSRDAEDSLIVQVLKSHAGAIPIVKGNVTQLMMLPESTNHIWGRSLNPHNRDRTPGGSSGGDAALVASGCVPLSVSSDVAGSIRIPASFCGVVGFKPSSQRVSGKGNMSPRLHDKHGTRYDVRWPDAASMASFLSTLLLLSLSISGSSSRP